MNVKTYLHLYLHILPTKNIDILNVQPDVKINTTVLLHHWTFYAPL